MEKYIALLRGVNVGGKNKISMPLLKTAFEDENFLEVSTYINSGNIIFKSNMKDINEIKVKCEKIIKQNFDIDISVVIITNSELKDMLIHAPAWWDMVKEDKNNAIFVIPPATADDIILEVGNIKPEYEKVYSYKNLIFWTAPKETFSKTRWAKIVGTTTYSKITIRNANTTKKLLVLSEDKV